ncbi:MAG: prolipoprotein diacylglyceryl transferase [bacterium]
MIIPSLNSPYILQTDSISIKWYGVLVALAIALCYILILREIRRGKIDESKFDTFFLITILSGLVGARIGFVIQNISYYSQDILGIFKFWDGGLSIHGAIILGVLGLYISTRVLKLNFVKISNIIAPYLFLGGAIGRWGNFFNQEIIGKPATGLLKMSVDLANRSLGFENIQYFHPVFLYESILFILAFTLYFIFRKKLKNFAIYYTLIVYSLIRVIVEFWRIDYRPIFLHLDLAQIVSLAIIFISIIFCLALSKKTSSSV